MAIFRAGKRSLKIDNQLFRQSMDKIAKQVNTNTVLLANQIGKSFMAEVKNNIRWESHTGTARRGMDYKVIDGKNKTTVMMSGSAKNYKRGKDSSADYMEYLEFAHDEAYAVLYPTWSRIYRWVWKNLGFAVISGKMDVDIQRDREASRHRTWRNYYKRRGVALPNVRKTRMNRRKYK